MSNINDLVLKSFIYEFDNSPLVGKHKHIDVKTFPKKQILMGKEVEKEHSDNPKQAIEIAKDHLAELPDYYTRLNKMEKEGERDLKNKKIEK